MAWDLFASPGVIIQLDGTAFGGDNCACATAAMHAMSQRQGRRPLKGSPWPPTGASIRRASGDTSGGLNVSTVDATLNRVYGIDPDFQIATTAQVEVKLATGYGVTFLHWYGPISDAGLSGSPGFRGNHSSFVSAISVPPQSGALSKRVKSCDPLYDGRRAGIPRGPQWVPWQSWVRAGELLRIGDSTRMVDRYGPGKLYVGFTRVPYRPGIPISYMRYSVAFGEGSFYVYDVVNGVIKSRRARMFSGPTSARCGPPAVYPWPGNTARRLVRMSVGALAGQWIAVPQGSCRLIEKEVKAG
jgi:hypothetical protein